MKIRIKGNSLRYRLTKSDINSLITLKYIEERAIFGKESLIYAIRQTDSDDLNAKFEQNKIILSMPAAMIKELAETDRVGFVNAGDGLHLLVEKDFKCLDAVAEDQSDNYPNPLAPHL